MASFNGAPTGDNSANNGGYTPESFSDTNDTAQLPKLDEHTNGFNSNNTPDTLPSTNQEQNAAEGNNTERKSHLGRNLVIGGVAVALAFSAWAFSQNGDTAKPTSDADSKPVITEGYDNEQSYVNDEQTEPVITQPETEPTSSNGLTVDELVDELYPNQSLDEALHTDPTEVGEEIAHWLATDGGYNTDVKPHADGRADAGFDVGGIVITPNGDDFHITILLYSNPNLYEYNSSVIPTVDEARQLALQNIPQQSCIINYIVIDIYNQVLLPTKEVDFLDNVQQRLSPPRAVSNTLGSFVSGGD